MEHIGELIENFPVYLWGIIVVLLAVGAGYLIWRGLSRSLFLRRLTELVEKPHRVESLIGENYSSRDLLRFTGALEKAAERWPEMKLLELTGAADVWIQKLSRTHSARWAKRILSFLPEQGLFTVFGAALQSAKCAEVFNSWLEHNPDLLALRRVALSGKGESFDGRKARDLLVSRLDQVREMAGDPEWASRYMALKVLLHDDDPRSERALQEAFHDPHSLVRRTVVEEYSPPGGGDTTADGEENSAERLYRDVLDLLLNDFVYEVRRAARLRIARDFGDRSIPQGEGLSTVQALHLLEQLDRESEADHNFALNYLEGENEELRLVAARFLDRAGFLETLCMNAELTDRGSFDRRRRLLLNAAKVNVVSFLDILKKGRDTNIPAGALIIAAEILEESGPVELITRLVKKTLRHKPGASPVEGEVFLKGLRTASLRGNDAAAAVLSDSLMENRKKEESCVPILENLTGRQGDLYVPVLLQLLEDGDFAYRDALHGAFVKFDPALFMDRLIDIISLGREEYPHTVRISAFKVLGMLGLPYCLQMVLEHMTILPLQQAREFAVHLSQQNGGEFVKRVLRVLEGEDGKVRSAVIAAIPATEKKDFVKPLREALSDADPNVRSAAAWALLEYGDTRSTKEVRAMLRDPVERVRREASRALGEYGNDSILSHFKELWDDENEVESVKYAAIEGLRASSLPKAVEILVAYLQSTDSPGMERTIIEALSCKREKKELAVLVEKLKDGDQETRSKIIEAFERMGLEAEGMLVELLREDIVSLRPYITSVLEETGYIDYTVRKLSHRDPQIRRETAELLSLIGTAAAFRGIVLAARDPDEQVRVMVTRALERLNSEEGREILEKLQQDPDRKIRKFTLWALERMDATLIE